MRHVTLTCKKHPRLRWSCKSIAYSPGHGYNGARHIFYLGTLLTEEEKRSMGQSLDTCFIEAECLCGPEDLVLAPEDSWSGMTIAQQKIAMELE